MNIHETLEKLSDQFDKLKESFTNLLNKKEDNKDHSQDLIRSQAKILDYLHKPDSKMEIRTASSIERPLIYPLAAIQTIRNGLKQNYRAKIYIDNICEDDWPEYVKSQLERIQRGERDEFGKPIKDPRMGRKAISFKTDSSLVDERNNEFVEEILLLSISGAKRADSIIIMEKDKKSNKTSDVFGAFSNLNKNEESEEPLEIEDTTKSEDDELEDD